MAGILAVVGRVFSLGYVTNTPSGHPRMAADTGLAFVLAGCALWLLRGERPRPLALWTARLCAVTLVAATTLIILEYLLAWSTGIQLSFFLPRAAEFPGEKTAFLTAVSFVLFGTALLLIDAGASRMLRYSEMLVGTGLLISLLALIGYACGARSFYQWTSIFGGRAMAVETAILFTGLGAGILAARPQAGLMKILTSRTASGTMARRLILLPVLIPLATGLVKVLGLRTGIYNGEIASWFFAFLNLTLFTAAIWWSAGLLFRAELEQRAAEQALQKNNAELEHRIANRTLELSSAEAKFRTLVEQSIVGIYAIQDGRFVYVNPKMGEIFLCPMGDLTSRPVTDFIIEEDRDLATANIRKRLDGVVHHMRYTLRMKRKDGATIHVEVYGSRSEYNGRPAILGTLLDVTERINGEKALRDSELLFRSVWNGSGDGLRLTDKNGNIIAVNEAYCELAGMRTEELEGKPFTASYADSGDEEERLRTYRERFSNRTIRTQMERRVTYRSGKTAEVEVIGSFVQLEKGEPLFLGVFRDITERKRAENALRESEQRHRLLFENLTELVCECSPDGTFLYVSPTYKSILGYTSDELLHTSVFANVHPEDVPMVGQKFGQMEATGSYRYRDKGGAWRWLESSGRRFTTPEGEERAVIITRDVTDKRRLEEQLLQAQKMEAIGTLAGGIAHDFNNILAAIMGNAQLLEEDLQAKDAPESVGQIVQATRRASDLVRRILAFSRKEEQQRIIMKLQPVVAEAMSLLRASLPATIRIETVVNPGCPTVLADPTQVHQIVMNLATNSAHAMKGQAGCLTIGLKSFEADVDFARMHPPLRPGPYVRLEVTDTGCGMDNETVKRIFEPFFTTKPVGEGTGLGLSAVHGIMQNHEGAVTVYSEAGKGTTFCLFFPAVLADTAVVEEEAAKPTRGNGERILVVDDEPGVATLAMKLLTKIGYNPTVFHNSADALAAFCAQPAQFDAVITDLTMPHTTGLALAHEIRQLRPDLPIILTTGYSGLGDIQRADEAGIRHLLSKPFSLQTLTQTLERALNEKQPAELNRPL